MTNRAALIALLLSSAALASCGKTGLLEQPAPMFGADAKARAAAAKKADTTAPIVDDPDSRPMTNGPSPQTPGQPNNPFASGPQGAIPNPGTSPNP